LFQLAWLYRLWKLDPKKSEKERRETEQIVDFVPYYAVGNLCIAGMFLLLLEVVGETNADDGNTVWMLFWNSSALKTSNIFVLINSSTQLYYIFFRLQPMNTSSSSSVLTHIVSKTFAGIGVLDFLHNGSVAYFNHENASTAAKIVTGVIFGGLATSADWIFGGCLVYDLVALAVGQGLRWGPGQTGWRNLLGVYALCTAGIVVGKNWLR
jgi:hypothetical protein